MTELFVILVATVLVNNFVLMRFLGLCPFMGVSRNLEAATGMSLATAFVLTLSSATAYLLHVHVLVPLELEYLRTITFILVIAASVQFTEIMVRRLSPLLDQVLGIYIPLIATNCAVLGVALLNVQQSTGFVQSVFYGLGAAGGFALPCMKPPAKPMGQLIRPRQRIVRRSVGESVDGCGMLDHTADIVKGDFAQASVAVAGKHVLAVFAEGHVYVHS